MLKRIDKAETVFDKPIKQILMELEHGLYTIEQMFNLIVILEADNMSYENITIEIEKLFHCSKEEISKRLNTVKSNVREVLSGIL